MTAPRRRRRLGQIAVIGFVLAAFAVAGLVWWLEAGDDTQLRIVDNFEFPDQVPLVGIDVEGWSLADSGRTDASCCTGEDGTGRAVFAAEVGAIGPHLEVGVLPQGFDMIADDSIDLGPDVEDAYYSGDLIFWTQADQTGAYVEGYGVDRADLEAYARLVAPNPVDPQTVPAPAGLGVDRRGARSLTGDPVVSARYELDGGSLTVEVSDEVGWLEDRLQPFPDGVPVDVAPNALGEGSGLLADPADPARIVPGSGSPPFQRAFWLTADGLGVVLSAEGPGAAGIVRQVLEEGRLVVLDG